MRLRKVAAVREVADECHDGRSMFRSVKRLFCAGNSHVGAAVLLGLSFAIGCTQIYWNNFIDEGDNLAGGVLLSHGQLLYRDVFSHHFPFPYYWVAAVARCCGVSIFAQRLSLLVFQTTAFGVAVCLTPFPLALAMAAVTWRTIGFPYYGNMLIYPNFTAAALIPVWAVTLAAAGESATVRRIHVIALGVFSAIAVLSDPLTIYPVVLSLGVLAVSNAGPRTAARAAAITVGLASFWLVYLVTTGSLGAFVSEAIRFNSEVYSKYTRVDPLPYRQVFHQVGTLLNLFDGRWLRLPSAVDRYLHPDQSLFTGFFYRAAIVMAAIILLAQRKILGALFIYATAAVLTGTLGEERFRANPFILVALFAAAWCVTGEWRRGTMKEHERIMAAPRGYRPGRFPRLLLNLARVSVAAFLGWLFLAGAQGIVSNRLQLSYAANYRRYEERARVFRWLSCDRHDVALVYYPSDPLIHVFTDMPPASPYMFMFPWVAETALPEVIRSLETKLAVVFVDLDGEIWGRRNRDYMAALIRFLEERYVKVSPGTYRSPALAEQCPFTLIPGATHVPGSRDRAVAWYVEDTQAF